MPVENKLAAARLCLAIASTSINKYASKTLRRESCKYMHTDEINTWKCTSSAQTAYHAVELLTNVSYDDSMWTVVDARVVCAYSVVERPEDNIGVLALYGDNDHHAFFVNGVVIQSRYSPNDSSLAHHVPHETYLTLSELSGNIVADDMDVELIYIKLDASRLSRFFV